MILTEVMLIYISWAIFDLPKFSYEILPVVSEYTDGFNSKMFALFITDINADGGGAWVGTRTPLPPGRQKFWRKTRKRMFFKHKIQLLFPLSPGQILNGYYSLKNIILALIQD